MATALATPYDQLDLAPDVAVPPSLATVHRLRPSAPRASSVIYLRRRVTVATVAVLAVLALALAFQSSGSAATGATAPALVTIAETVTLLPGMTLWELAVDATAPGQDPRVVLDSIRQLNGFSSDLVPAWTTVAIPGA